MARELDTATASQSIKSGVASKYMHFYFSMSCMVFSMIYFAFQVSAIRFSE